MRLSVEKTDPGYRPDYRLWDVTLDGQPVSGVITADVDGGFVLAYVMENGRVARKAGEIQTNTLFGKVELVRRPGGPTIT